MGFCSEQHNFNTQNSRNNCVGSCSIHMNRIVSETVVSGYVFVDFFVLMFVLNFFIFYFALVVRKVWYDATVMSLQCLVSRETRIQSHGGVEGQMGRSGGARETWLQTRSTASGTATKPNPVQESLWNYLPSPTTIPSPTPPPPITPPKPTSQTTTWTPTPLLTPLPRSPPSTFQPWCLAQHMPSPGMFRDTSEFSILNHTVYYCTQAVNTLIW